MPSTKDASVSSESVVELADDSVQTGQRTAKIAAEILRESGFVIPAAAQREAILIAFVRAGYVIYGKAFDVVKCSGPVDLTSSDEVLKNIDRVTLFEVKSTNKPTVKPSFRGVLLLAVNRRVAGRTESRGALPVRIREHAHAQA